MTEKIRVLRIHNRLHLGGPIYNVTYLTRYLPAEKYETKLVIGPPLPDEVDAGFFLEREGVPYTLVPEMKRQVNPLHDLKAFFKLRSLIREFRPHIVHTHTAKAGTLGRLAAFSCGVPVTVHTFHGHVFHSYFSPPVNLAVRWVEKCLALVFSSRIVAISPKQKWEITRQFKVVSSDKCSVIPLGFDLEKFGKDTDRKRTGFREKFGLKPKEVAIGIIGRFAPIKNHMLLFRAFALLKEKFPAVFEKTIIFCVGDGDLKTGFTDFLKTAGIPFSDLERSFAGGGVVFTSWIRQVEEVLPGFDLVALTSDNEGTPLSLIEAQAAGVAVLSTRVGGVEDVVHEGKTGVLVAPGNAFELMEAIAGLAENRDALAEMGRSGREWVKHSYSYHRLVSDVDLLYDRLLRRRNIFPDSTSAGLSQYPRITIITVTKNRLETLRATIQSIGQQDYPNIEYIIIDGGSTDGTAEFLSNHPGVSKYLSEPDAGIYDAMNKGIREATGEIIAFLNSDDVYTNGQVISSVIKAFQRSNAEAVYGDIVYVSPDDTRQVKRFWKSGRYRHNCFLWGWMPPHPAFFVRRDCLVKYGGFKTDLSLSADYEIMLRLIHIHGIFIEYVPRVMVKMRMGGASNADIASRLKANRQDREAWRVNALKPYFFTIWLKPLRKFPQFLTFQKI